MVFFIKVSGCDVPARHRVVDCCNSLAGRSLLLYFHKIVAVLLLEGDKEVFGAAIAQDKPVLLVCVFALAAFAGHNGLLFAGATCDFPFAIPVKFPLGAGAVHILFVFELRWFCGGLACVSCRRLSLASG